MTNKDINWYFWQKYIPSDYSVPERPDWYQERPARKHYDKFILLDHVDSYLDSIRGDHLLLSGGLDSSTLAARVKPKHVYILKQHPQSYDESKYAIDVANYLNLDWDVFAFPHNVDDLIPDIIKGDPFGDSSVIALYYLCKQVSRYTDSVLTGDAGDEMFGGYETYKAYKLAKVCPKFVVECIQNYPFTPSDKKVTLGFKAKRFARNFDDPPILRHFNWMATFTDKERKKLLGPAFIPAVELVPKGYGDSLREIQRADMDWYFRWCMKPKADRAALEAGITLRAPLLETGRYILNLPDKYRVRGVTTKWLLRKMAKGLLPKSIIKRKKRGFTTPVSLWVKTSGLIREWTYEHCDPQLNHDYVKEMYRCHLAGTHDYARALWLVFVWNYSYYRTRPIDVGRRERRNTQLDQCAY